MCGIVGYIGRKKAAPVILRNLKRLEYRGYDSCGIATLSSGLNIKKDAGRIDEIQKKMKLDNLPGSVGIGHTRWATHGNVSRRNAHPHVDCKKEIAIVHNGIISNYAELREELIKRGHVFESETDSECMAHLIEENYEGGIEKALRAALEKVKGTYALLVLSTHEPDKLLCARNESPLVLGIGIGEMFVGSDVASFLHFTKKAVPLDDGEYAVITEKECAVKEINSGRMLEKEILEITWNEEAAEKEGYEHFMLKEIFEQPQTIINALHVYPQDIRKLAEMIRNSEKVYFAAAGSSLHAALVAEYWFSQLCDKFVVAVDASELMSKGVIDKNTLVIGITQSGETYDTLAAMRHAKNKGARIAAIVNVIGSTATRLADHVVLQGSGIEISVCATKTFTSQLTILMRTAIELAEMLGRDVEKIKSELLETPARVEEVLRLNEEIKKVAVKYFRVKNYIYIGKGINLPSALEGALKLKEITYNHAEGMSGGMLKHGTISLIDRGMKTVAIVPAKGENRTKIISNVQEVKARGGVVIGITSGKPVEQCDVNIVAPECDELISPIVFAPIYQLLAYHTAANLKRDVDKPRALAKSVTVE
ncbi:MAG: glutamine--fructose-6-phosphate transaminase (isomerizing) [Euryarchaeota archaeon]|nr:glutamine--fructose-6-phosphate transaminase (isomerizing) [Euryarchaeota archaeon]